MSQNKSVPFATPITACRLCDGVNLNKVLELVPTPAGDHYLPKNKNPEKLPVFPLDLYQCGSCGHVQLGAVVDPSYLYRDYIYTTSSSIGLGEHFKDYALSTAKKLSLKPGAFVLEIGSNDGTMLRAFQDLGMKVLGVDPAQEIALKATISGIPTIAEFFTQEISKKILSEHGYVDLVIANNVMANVANPKEIVLAVQEILSPSGVFIFETGYLRYIAEGHVFDNIYHEHIDYFSVRPLERFFNSIDMSLFDVHVTQSKGSSIRCFTALKSSARKIERSVEFLKEREIKYEYHTPSPYSRLGVLLEETKSKMYDLLQPAVTRGERIVGFGASVGVTTLLYKFNLQKFVVALYDDNPSRDGLFSPGLGIPVCLAEREFLQNPPDIVVLLAWRYADQILQRHAHMRKNGVKFLNFFPNVTFF